MATSLPALAIRPPQDPIEGISRLVQLKSLLGQQQLQQGQQQLQQQSIQEGQIRLNDVQAQSKAMREWDGKELDDLPGLILKNGGSAQAVFGMKSQLLKYKTDLAGLDKDTLANEKVKNDFFAQQIDNVKKLPPEQQAAAFEAAKADALKRGHLDPQMAQNLQYQGPDQLDLLEKSLMGHAAATSDEMKRREVSASELAAQARATGAATSAAEFKAKLPGGPLQPIDMREYQDFIAKNPGKGPSDYLTWKAQQTSQAEVPAKIATAVGTELQKQKALAVPLEQVTNTTMAGRKYINRDDLPKEAAGFMEQQAAAQGVRVVDKDTAGTLSDIDDAKANMQTMLNLVKGKLAASPAERIYKGPENKLEAAMQTDPTLASMGTFRNAAIKTMRAVAGSKGLRINQYEVQLAIDNDIPKMTDTWDVAAKKIDTLNKFLDNAENTHLTLNRAAGQTGGQPGGAGATGGLQVGQTITVKGKQLKVTAVHPDGSFDAK